MEGPIPFFALCEHHVLPFFGRAYIGYVAHEQIIGISKLTRLVRVATRRFGVQERMTHEIADGLVSMLEPARRRRLSRGPSPVHPDARRPRARPDDPDERLPRDLRRAARPAPRVRRHERDRARAMTAETPAPDAPAGAWRIERLFESPDAPLTARGGALPPALARRYGADLAIALRTDRPTIVSNFVSTLDGVVAFDT